ncbi:MAG: hypothetical protein AOA65_1317 [Candidatus Bathyarchaeota archaeon BA1]|nr:MAG: hypothetical protein AOA65_1317 [Candidatus Bathyarchaeota archaeon BA1]
MKSRGRNEKLKIKTLKQAVCGFSVLYTQTSKKNVGFRKETEKPELFFEVIITGL